MAVAGPDTTLLFCEGKPGSLDAQLLHRMVRSSSIQVIPAGGKHGLRAFIEGRLSLYRERPPHLAFRDRDFDREPGKTVTLLPLERNKRIYLTHRSCIESYLLDPVLMHTYWSESADAPAWKHGPSPGAAELARWVGRAAREIADYQAVRWSLAKLQPGKYWPRVQTTWTKGSGHLPGSLDLEPCLQQARKLVEGFRESTAAVSAGKVTEYADSYSQKFAKDSFWQNDGFLRWFHGKDLKKAIQKAHPHSISMDHFCAWAIVRFRWARHADLQGLSAVLDQSIQ